MVIMKVFYSQYMVISAVIVSSWRHVVLLSELSRCVQQDCTFGEGDAMAYCSEAKCLIPWQGCGESNVKL